MSEHKHEWSGLTYLPSMLVVWCCWCGEKRFASIRRSAKASA